MVCKVLGVAWWTISCKNLNIFTLFRAFDQSYSGDISKLGSLKQRLRITGSSFAYCPRSGSGPPSLMGHFAFFYCYNVYISKLMYYKDTFRVDVCPLKSSCQGMPWLVLKICPIIKIIYHVGNQPTQLGWLIFFTSSGKSEKNLNRLILGWACLLLVKHK